METKIETQPGAALIQPANVTAEFTNRGPLPAETQTELDALEAKINGAFQDVEKAKVEDVAQALPQTTPEVKEPETKPEAKTEVEIPKKFQNPDGTLNQEKLEKSAVNLKDYLDMERELSKLKQSAQPKPFTVDPAFQQQLSKDLAQDPAAVMINMNRAAVLEAQQMMENRLAEINRKFELTELSQKDPWIFSKEGLDTLKQVMIDNPFLQSSPTPWTHAYQFYKGSQNGRSATVQSAAAPAPATRQAPILPGGQAQPSIPTGVMTETDLRRSLDKRFPNNPDAQSAYLEGMLKSLEKSAR